MKKLSLFLIPLILVCLGFSVSCVSRQFEVTESYAETLYRTESHTEILNESQKYIKPDWERYVSMYFSGLEWGEEGAESYFDGYRINASENISSKVKLILAENPQASKWGIMIIDLTGLGPIPDFPLAPVLENKLINGKLGYQLGSAQQRWIDNLNAITMNPVRCLSFVRSDEFYDQDIEVNLGGADEFVIITCVPRGIISPPTVIKKVQLISYEEKIVEEQIPYRVTKERTVTKTEKVPFWEVIFSK